MNNKYLEVRCVCGCLVSAPRWAFEQKLTRCIVCGRLPMPDPPDPDEKNRAVDPPPQNKGRGIRKQQYVNGGPRKWGRR
jgi:hypothetical protein